MTDPRIVQHGYYGPDTYAGDCPGTGRPLNLDHTDIATGFRYCPTCGQNAPIQFHGGSKGYQDRHAPNTRIVVDDVTPSLVDQIEDCCQTIDRATRVGHAEIAMMMATRLYLEAWDRELRGGAHVSQDVEDAYACCVAGFQRWAVQL